MNKIYSTYSKTINNINKTKTNNLNLIKETIN